MSWSEERVETLKRLAAQGASASQIAAEIGHGTTRNAVIGKALRIGVQLMGAPCVNAGAPAGSLWSAAENELLRRCRNEGLQAADAVKALALAGFTRTAAACARRALVMGVAFPPYNGKHAVVRVKAVRQPAIRAGKKATPVASPADRMACFDVSPQGGVGLMDLAFDHCRWPLGDPQAEAFYFCGEPRDGGRVYCAAHAALAYVPIQPRVRAPRPRDMRDNRRVFA